MAEGNLSSYLNSLGKQQLIDLVLDLAGRDDDIERLLKLRATPTADAKSFTSMVTAALRTGSRVDYRYSFEVARQALDALDILDGELTEDTAATLQPALLKATTRLQQILTRVDDSSGVIGDQGQRALDLYAKACRLAPPKGPKLGAWLVTFELDSPGWPAVTLADFVPALDDKSWAAFRTTLADAIRAADPDAPEAFTNFHLTELVLGLADHDGDVDRAVELLTTGHSPAFHGIIERLSSADRTDEALDWLGRARAAHRVNASGRDNRYDVPTSVAIALYRAAGRDDDAMDVAREAFAHGTRGYLSSDSAYDLVLATARELGRFEQEKATLDALILERSVVAGGALAVHFALHDGDVERAWDLADSYGAGWAWRELADATADSDPARVLPLYRGALAEALRYADKRSYNDAADLLTQMRDLYERAGRPEVFAALVEDIRATHKRRTSFIAILDRKTLR